MKFLLVSFASILIGIATATPSIIARDSTKSLDPKSLPERDLLDEGTESLFSEPLYSEPLSSELGDVTTDFDPDALLFDESADTPLVYDQASAGACDETQSSSNSLDPFLDQSGLETRDLIDMFPGLRDLVNPLNQLDTPPKNQLDDPPKDVCRPRENKFKKPQPGIDPELPAPKPENDPSPLEPGQCYENGYIWSLCCAGPYMGLNVRGCITCEFFQVNIDSHRYSVESIPSISSCSRESEILLDRVSNECNDASRQFCCKDYEWAVRSRSGEIKSTLPSSLSLEPKIKAEQS